MKSSPALEYYLEQLANPLTAFLDLIPRGQQLRIALTKELPQSPDACVRALTVTMRLRANAQLSQFHVPLGRDIDLAETILDLLEQSYATRNPTPKIIAERAQIAKEIAANAMEGGAFQNEAIGRALIGTPGSGKTRTVTRVLGKIPQIVHHDVNRYPLLLPKTITWIRVETPANRKLSALAENIIGAIGLALGEDLSSLKKGNISVKLQNAAQLCMEFQVGLIVIDEIQHVLRKNNVPDLELVNFLVELSNRVSIPLLLVGTPQAEFVAGTAVRQARRMLGPRWEPLARTTKTWTNFSRQLLEYQFTKDVAPSEELEPTLFDLSQGLPAIAVTLFQFAQRSALLLELETGNATKITAEMLKAAFTRYMRPVASMLAALRSGNEAEIAKFHDLKVDAAAVDAMLLDQADERSMRNARKIMRVTMGVDARDSGKPHNWRRDAN